MIYAVIADVFQKNSVIINLQFNRLFIVRRINLILNFCLNILSKSWHDYHIDLCFPCCSRVVLVRESEVAVVFLPYIHFISAIAAYFKLQ